MTLRGGSLINHLAGNSKQVAPEVGMGATELCYTDRHAYTIIDVLKNGKEIVVQQDTATRTDKNGLSDSQDYSYERNPNGVIRNVTLRSTGAWVTKGEGHKNGSKWWVGVRDKHHDFSF